MIFINTSVSLYVFYLWSFFVQGSKDDIIQHTKSSTNEHIQYTTVFAAKIDLDVLQIKRDIQVILYRIASTNKGIKSIINYNHTYFLSVNLSTDVSTMSYTVLEKNFYSWNWFLSQHVFGNFIQRIQDLSLVYNIMK